MLNLGNLFIAFLDVNKSKGVAEMASILVLSWVCRDLFGSGIVLAAMCQTQTEVVPLFDRSHLLSTQCENSWACKSRHM